MMPRAAPQRNCGPPVRPQHAANELRPDNENLLKRVESAWVNLLKQVWGIRHRTRAVGYAWEGEVHYCSRKRRMLVRECRLKRPDSRYVQQDVARCAFRTK